MEMVSRRSILAWGAVAAATPLLAISGRAVAQVGERYGPDEGEELAPGVRLVTLGERHSLILGYGSVTLRDLVFQPGAELAPSAMSSDMVCHMLEGELLSNQQGEELTVGPGDVWTCAVGTTEGARNDSPEVGIMRIAFLTPA